MKKATGIKHDGEKVPLQLIPGHSLLAVGRVLRHGAQKYAAHNWRGGIAYSRLIGACFRHLVAFNEGEDLDPETAESHVAHLACEALFLLEFVAKGRPDLDDRYLAPGAHSPAISSGDLPPAHLGPRTPRRQRRGTSVRPTRARAGGKGKGKRK